jgi:TP901 family phage tail tape measure protein
MAQRITVDIDGDVSKLVAAVGQANSAIGGIGTGATGQQIGALGKTLTTAVTLPLVGIAAAGVKTAAEFDVSMASLGVNAGIAGKDLDSLGDLAIKLGAETVFSANEAAAAMLELSKSGMNPAAIAGGALAATLDLAATEGIGLSEAATIMANTMNTFGLSAEDSTKITDLLAAGAVASTASVEGLAAGLKYAGSTASTLKVPLDDTVTALAAMNNAGIDATTAGTSFNRFLLGLVPSTEKATKLMDNLDISFQNADGTMKSMPDIITTLQNSLTGMSDAQQVATLKTLFGVEGMRAATTLLKLNTDGYNELNDQVNKNGVASELANARMDGMSGALESLKGSAETAALKIGKALEPAIMFVSQALTIAINLFTALPGPIQTVVAAGGAFIAVLGPILMLMGALKTSTSLATGALLAKQAALGLVTAAQWLFNAAMSANPIGLVIIAIAAIIAIIVVLVKNWDTVTEVVGKVWEAIKNFAKDAWDAIKKFGSRVGEFVDDVIADFQALPSAMLNVGKNIVTGIWNGIQSLAGWLKTKVFDFFGNLVPSWAKKVLGIGSPSKVFARYGRFIVEGLAVGIERSAELAREATQGLGIDTISAFPSAIAPRLQTGAGRVSAPINITINAGAGADPYSVGRAVTSAIDKYSRISSVPNQRVTL